MSHRYFKRRDPKHCSDIKDTFLVSVVCVGVIMLIVLFAFGIDVMTRPTIDSIEKYNQAVTTFNQLPKSTRQALDPVISGKLSKAAKLSPKDLPWKFSDLLPKLVEYLPLALLIFSAVVLLAYWNLHNKDFRLADFPFRTMLGWEIFLTSLPIGWPFYLVSRIAMYCDLHGLKTAEKAKVKRLAKENLTFEPAATTPIYDPSAQHVYVKFRTQHFRDIQQQKIFVLNEKIVQTKYQIQEHGQAIAKLQRTLGEQQSQLRELEALKTNREVSKNQAQSEWQQILTMRGVTKITASKRKARKKNQFLRVLIKVRVPYHSRLYDFGDYEVTFYEGHFTCKKVRSGVRRDNTNVRVVYNDPKYDFCFGSRRDTIEGYAANGCIIEALTLIIDSFHSVNPGDEHYIPGCYREVRTVERAERRLKFQQIFTRR